MIFKTILFFLYSLSFVYILKTRNLLSFTFGPSANLYLYGFLINNWYKWTFLMFMICLKTSFESYFITTLSHWYQYKIEEPYSKGKKKWNNQSVRELIILNLFNISSFIIEISNYMIRLKYNDIQLFIPDFISTVIISKNIHTYNILSNNT